jgi:predicted metal-dependent phosphoesterase TrpH
MTETQTTVQRVKVDLHMHSEFSRDSLNTLNDIVKTCQRKGLDVVCLTDHNVIEGALRLRDISPLPVIIGQEIATLQGELIAYFIEEHVPPQMPLEETIERVREQGGIVSVPHPFDRIRKEAVDREKLMTVLDQLDAVEVFNSRCLLPSFNTEARMLAQAHGLPGTAGSDAHSLIEIGTTYVEMEPFSTQDEFLSNLGRAHVHGRHSLPLVHMSSTISKIIKRWRNRQTS